jgi:hypothetical protein
MVNFSQFFKDSRKNAEKKLKNVFSEIVFDKVSNPKNKRLCEL